MVARFGLLLLVGWAGMAAARPPADATILAAQDVASEQVERTGLPPVDLAWLDDPSTSWKHLQTEHFVLHHDQKMFAAKVARLGEQFYAAISADLPDLRDRVAPQRSHIFIFRNPSAWQAVVRASPGIDSWAASFVRGQAMYLQETGTTTADQMETLAHEMTHLVFNRFLPRRLPLWLNEGLAEYYGDFAYRDARGLGQSKGNAFRPLKRWTPLADLLAATEYPVDPDDVREFYATAKYLAGYLLLRQPREKWNVFFARVLAGEPAEPALLETYGWPDGAALENDFARFAR